MVRSFAVLSALLAVLATPAASRAQEQSAAEGGMLGLGVAIPTLGGGFVGGASLFLPIEISERLRFEPEFGFSQSDETDDAFLVGFGLLFKQEVAPQVRGYVGPRLQLLRFGSEEAFGGALAAGGEWLPVPRVAIGAEGRLTIAWADGQTASGTSSLLFVRIFLN